MTNKWMKGYYTRNNNLNRSKKVTTNQNKVQVMYHQMNMKVKIVR